MGEFTRIIKEDYGLKKKLITARNPQADAIIERVHRTIGQMIRTFEVQEMDNVIDPFKGVLTAISFAVRTRVHTTLQSSPTQLVFGRDHMPNIKHEMMLVNLLRDGVAVRESKSTATHL